MDDPSSPTTTSSGNDSALKVARCADAACTTAATETVDTDEDLDNISIAIGADGLALISYIIGDQNSAMRVAHCENLSCADATVSPFGGSGRFEFTSLAIIEGLGLISYQDNNGPVVATLKAARCQNNACTSSTTATIDGAGDLGAVNSLTVGVDGLPLVAYVIGNDLGIAHCSNIRCVPYFRSR